MVDTMGLSARDRADVAAHSILSDVRYLLDADETPPLAWLEEAERGLRVIIERARQAEAAALMSPKAA